jgi:arabinoxylan arabinofuranohydrolase
MTPPRALFLFTLAAVALTRTAAADAWDVPHAANPILPGYYADPSLVQHEGKYYLYATLDPWGGRTLGCWESPDFRHWTYRALNWPTKEACTSPTSKGAMVWAPSVIRTPKGKFFMYVSVGNEVWVGSANHPLGPWTDAHGGKPLIPETYRPGYHMIDAEVFVDDDGSTWLYWGSGWGWKNGRCFAVKLKPDLVTFDGEPADVTPANYFEGPFMFKHGGRYYLTYSQGVTIADTYQVHYAVGDSPLGPFTEAANSPILVTDHAKNVVSPGHHAIFSHDGRSYILYHRHSVPYEKGQAYRQTCVDELSFTADGLIEKVVPSHTGPALVQGRDATRLAATAMASSEVAPQHRAVRVLDDNHATRWAPAADTQGGWLQLDLGRAQSVGRVTVRFEYAWKPYRFVLEASNDGQAWTTLADHRTTPFTGSPFVLTPADSLRYLRLVFPADAKAGEMSVWEFAAYALPPPPVGDFPSR